MTAGKRMNRCPYCGRKTYKQACAAHRDLLALDPVYKLVDTVERIDVAASTGKDAKR